MLRKVLVLIASVVICVSGLTGCGKSSDEPEVKTEAEYKAEAEKEITAENMDDELDKIEKEMEQDLKEEP